MAKSRLILSPILAPYKIPLLVLVAAYCSGILPKNSDAALLAFIVKIIEQHPLTDNEPVVIEISLTALLEKIKEVLLEDAKNTNQRNSLIVDYEIIESRVLNAVWSLKSLDNLHQFISKSKSLLVNTAAEGKEILSELPKDLLPKKLLTRKSFLGNFVLNCIKDFEALEFEESQKFWISFVQYRLPSYSIFNSINGGADLSIQESKENYFGDDVRLNNLINKISKNMYHSRYDTFNSNFEHKRLNTNENHEASDSQKFDIVSVYDLSKALAKQIRLLESFGTPTPRKLKATLELIAKQGNNVLPSSHYLTYLESINSSDYEGAFKALHGYFDYMMSSNSHTYYQYALLSLATLHAKFNSNQQALEAIKEAVLVARENNDNGCLSYLLSWLFDFLKNRPELKHDFFESNEQLLEFLKRKDSQAPDSNVVLSDSDYNSKAYQMEATQAILEGGQLNKILESIIKSGYIALNDDYDVESFIVSCHLQSSTWSRVGINDLAETYVSISLDSSQSQNNMNNVYQAISRAAWLEYENGNVRKVFTMLDTKNRENKTAAVTVSLDIIRSIFTAKQAINKNRLTFGKSLVERLKHQEMLNDVDFKNEVLLLSALVEYKLGNFSKAIKILTAEIKNYDMNPIIYNHYWYIRFGVLYCSIFCETKCSLRLIPMINKLIKLADQSSLISLMNELIIILSEILFKIGKVEEGFLLLSSSMPQILQYSDLLVKSRASYLLAKIDSSSSRCHPPSDSLSRILNSLELAITGFQKLNDYSRLKKCFELQISIGESTGNLFIVTHGKSSVLKLQQKINEELNYKIIV